MPAGRLYLFFEKHRFLLWAMVATIVVFLAWFAAKLRLEEDITKFIPKDAKTKDINFALENLKIRDKLVLIVHNTDPSKDPESIMECSDRLADTLLQTHPNYIKELSYKISDDLAAQTYDIFYNNLPVFLNDEDYAKIERVLQKDSVKATLASNYKTLLSPTGMVFGKFIRRDPLSLTPIALKKLQHLKFDQNFETNDGYIQTKDKQNVLIFITPTVKPSETEINRAFLKSLDGMIEQLKNEFSDAEIEYYGAAAVSTGNSDRIRSDSIFTSLFALALIVVIFLVFFKRPLVIFFILLPVAFGALFSLALLYFLKSEISAISIGAGSVILGIATNYSLHFFTHYKHEHSALQVIKDLTLPMLIGCVTTVGAFLSLQFAKSQALHDFGLFAGFSLIGAVLFSIIVLPHLLKFQKPSVNDQVETENGWLAKVLNYPFHKNKALVITFVCLTLVFVFTSGNVSFESDMMKMNYQDEKITKAQQHLDSINRFSLSNVFVVAKGKTLEEALRNNERVKEKLEDLGKNDVLEKYSTLGDLIVSDSLQQLRIQKWNAFWTSARKDTLKKHLSEAGSSLGFKPSAFEEFYEQLNHPFSNTSDTGMTALRKLVAGDWISEGKDLATVVSIVKADAQQKEKLYNSFEEDNEVIVFDKQHITSQFVEVISSDFNLILTITAALVFGFMLLSHGRIELALINFLPMVVSWVWILGIMGLLGLKFNIINIIISTFIFGLGDDYSIFILDGLSQEYKTGRKTLASYKTSILLSALTNIIGIGVLIFAEHPALKSIALITIIGMFTVLLTSFIVQPLLYNFLILNRRYRGLTPYTALNLLITGLGFLVFAIGSLLLTVFGMLLFVLAPIKKKKKKLVFHYCIMGICRMMLSLFVNVKKQVFDSHHADFSKPSVMISNHQSHIDLAMVLMLHPKIIVFTNDWVWNSPFYGYIVKMADFYPASKGYETAIGKMKELVKDGYSILIFPEGTRSASGDILRFHKGAFFLAQELQLDIQPILLHGTGDCVTKGDFHFKEGKLTLQYLPRVKPDNHSYGQTYQERSKKIRAYMRHEYQKLKDEQETVDYFRPKMIKNYLFKGPVLEWYCRIKTKLEDNYRFFEKTLPKNGKITDVGCGYGFLSLMLSFSGKEREIAGVDYDEEKIAVAANTASRSEKVTFVHADVTRYDFPPSDAFIINDVLHYLLPEEQVRLIELCANKLNPGGTMIIRDADADLKKRHLGTRYTEFFSTNSGFNKTKAEGLHFTSSSLIKTTLDKFHFLNYSVIDDTKLTSNITFVIKHIGN